MIACGEIGLDYYYDHSPREEQKRVFVRQMEIAAARKQPIIIHCRPSDGSTNAWDDTLEMIGENWAASGLGGILHCFTGEWEHARRAMDYGFLLSFAGNVTFPKAQAIRDVAGKVPLSSILVETDAPFLAPVPEPRQTQSRTSALVAKKSHRNLPELPPRCTKQNLIALPRAPTEKLQPIFIWRPDAKTDWARNNALCADNRDKGKANGSNG